MVPAKKKWLNHITIFIEFYYNNNDKFIFYGGHNLQYFYVNYSKI